MGVSAVRLSSGLCINSAADGQAGLAISGRLTTRISGLNRAIRIADDDDGISVVQANVAPQRLLSLVQSMRERSWPMRGPVAAGRRRVGASAGRESRFAPRSAARQSDRCAGRRLVIAPPISP